MGQARDEDGNIWEIDAQGNPVRLVAPAGPSVGRVVTLPQDPTKVAGDRRDQIRTDIAVQGEERQEANTNFNQTTALATDYNADPAVKAYRVAMAQFGQALNTGEGPQADLALTYAFAKAMDPDSVVRESEQGMVTDSQPWFQALVEKTKKQFNMDGAGNFTPEARDALRQQIASAVNQRQRVYDARREYYKNQAQTFGINPQMIVGEHDKTPFLEDIQKFTDRVNAPKEQVADQTATAEDGGLQGGVVTDDSPDTFHNSYLGQGMAGVNTGIADTLGAPVDVTTALMNLIPKGINAVANTDIPSIQNPFLGGQWFKDKMAGWGIYDPTDDPSKQFVRRVGESVGAATVPMGAASSLPRAGMGVLAGASGGIGAATAQRVFPDNPLAEFAGEVIGGGATGAGLLAAVRNSERRGIEAAVPTVEELKRQAGELYRTAENRGITADAKLTENLATDMRQALQDEGRISPTGRITEVYPKAKEGMQLVDDYSGQNMNPTQMQTVRSVISDALTSPDSSERRLGRILTDTFDEWAAPLAPELPQARDISSRYLNAEKLERARELAGVNASKFSGSGFENALRTQYRVLDRNAVMGRGRYGDELQRAIEDVNRGTPVSNVARSIGKLAPTGVVSLGLGTGAPAAIGGVLGGPAGAMAAGGTAAALGTLGRAASTQMGIRNADIAELIARNGGALPQASVPAAFKNYAALLAAVEQAKYLGDRQQPQ